MLWGLACGPVAKTPYSQCKGHGFDIWLRNYILRVAAKSSQVTPKGLTCHNEDQRSCVLQLRLAQLNNFFFKDRIQWTRMFIFPLYGILVGLQTDLQSRDVCWATENAQQEICWLEVDKKVTCGIRSGLHLRNLLGDYLKQWTYDWLWDGFFP